MARQGTPVQNNETLMCQCQVAGQPRHRTQGNGHVPKAPEKRCVLWLSPPPSFLPHWRWGTKPEDRINKSTDAAISFHSLPLMNNRGQRLTLQDSCLLSACAHIQRHKWKHTGIWRQGVASSSIWGVINTFNHSCPTVKEQLLLVLYLTVEL